MTSLFLAYIEYMELDVTPVMKIDNAGPPILTTSSMSTEPRFDLLTRDQTFGFDSTRLADAIAINRKLTAGAQPDPLRRKHDEVMLFKGA